MAGLTTQKMQGVAERMLPPRQLLAPVAARMQPAALQAVKAGLAARGTPVDLFERAARPPLPALTAPLALPAPQLRLPNLRLPKLGELFGTRRPELERFTQGTAEFRGLLKTLRETPPSDPRFAQAERLLQSRYGYTAATAPRPGTLFVSPRLSTKELPGGQVTAGRFPTGTPITAPPEPLERLFASGRPQTVLMHDGTEAVARTPAEYMQLVAANRAAAGIRNPDGSAVDGTPKAVHLTMEGGGGLGKRYAAALQEMYAQGIVPTSVSGTSVGAIAAGYVAAGADAKQFRELATDPEVAKYFDFDAGNSGLAKGEFMYHHMDQKLRELTGILDRPVTFADLKMPCKIPAAILSDSQPTTDLTDPEGRLFVFSQETTPNTPLVYAMLASGAFPGVLPTVDLVDPTTSRTLVLTDSGVFDGIPMGLGPKGLPEVGLSLQEPAANHPADPGNNQVEKPTPAGDIDSSNPLAHGLNSLKLLKRSATQTKDFQDRTNPQEGQFMLALPIFDLEDARKRDKSLVFPYNPEIDPRLDEQGRALTRDFFARTFHELGTPGAKATNLTTQVPENLRFERTIDFDGKRFGAKYQGGDSLRFTREDGRAFDVRLGKREIEALYLDHLAFGSLDGQLKVVLDDHFFPWNKLRRELPI